MGAVGDGAVLSAPIIYYCFVKLFYCIIMILICDIIKLLTITYLLTYLLLAIQYFKFVSPLSKLSYCKRYMRSYCTVFHRIKHSFV